MVYSITISDSEVQRIVKHNSDIPTLMGQFGAAAAYLGIGLVLLKGWQKITRQIDFNHRWAAVNNTPEARLRASSSTLGSLQESASQRDRWEEGRVGDDGTENPMQEKEVELVRKSGGAVL